MIVLLKKLFVLSSDPRLNLLLYKYFISVVHALIFLVW